MSNLVYPVLPGRGFPSARSVLPPKVTIRTTPSQREFRSRDALLPRYQYSVPYEWLKTRADSPQLQTLLGFYLSVGGPFDSWLYLDPDDNSVSAQQFGVGDGVTTQFQLVRSFGGFAEPVAATVGSPQIYISGVLACNYLAPYGSFESDANGDGLSDGLATYSAGATGTVTYLRSTSPLVHGAYSQRVAASALGTGVGDRAGVRISRTDVLPGTGQRYTGSVFVRGTPGVRFSIVMHGKDHTGSVVDASSATVTMSLTYANVSVSSTMPAGTVSVDVYLYMESSTVGVTSAYCDCDAAQVSASETVLPFSASLAVMGPNAAVTFTGAPEPDAALTWSGQFYRRCRFLGDRLDTEKFMDGLFSAKRVEFISTKA